MDWGKEVTRTKGEKEKQFISKLEGVKNQGQIYPRFHLKSYLIVQKERDEKE